MADRDLPEWVIQTEDTVAEKPDTKPESAAADQERERDYMRGGKGRKDEVGGSGIYPASAPNVPADAEIRSEGGLVGHTPSAKNPERADEDEP
jgi:hypothetical protein